jgi:hypothetical protein
MSCAAQTNLCICQGANLQQKFRWIDKDSLNPIDISGYTARSMFRDTAESATVALSLTSASGTISLGGVSGTVILSASAASTSAITAGRYVFDIELINSSGYVRRLVEGTATVTREVTR